MTLSTYRRYTNKLLYLSIYLPVIFYSPYLVDNIKNYWNRITIVEIIADGRVVSLF